MSNMMGVNKKGQQQDIHFPKTLGGFMNPTKTYGMKQNVIGHITKMMGMMNGAIKNKKRKKLEGIKNKKRKKKKLGLLGNWALVKKTDGQCACTQKPSGQIIIGRFLTQRECEDGRAHNC